MNKIIIGVRVAKWSFMLSTICLLAFIVAAQRGWNLGWPWMQAISFSIIALNIVSFAVLHALGNYWGWNHLVYAILTGWRNI